MSTQAPAGAIAAAIVEFLRSHPPFDHVEDATLAALVAACRVAYFARGETIVSPAAGVPDALYIVNKGRVLVEQSDEYRAAGTPNLALGPGECFPLSALIGQRATTSIYRAAGDVFCYAVPAERVHELLRTSPALLEFATGHLALLLARAQTQVRNHAGQAALDAHGMSAALEDLLRRSPVSCAEHASTGEVLARMRDEKIGSMVIATADGVPVGIFTERDAVARVAAAGLDLRTPIKQVMTAAPLALPASASAGDAALLMARHGIRHVVVLDGAKFCGVVSERDLSRCSA